jgi:Flp pilus assembly pilin Flp
MARTVLDVTLNTSKETQMFHSGTAALLRSFAADQRGATVIEYGLIVSAVSVAVMGAVFSAGEGLRTVFQTLINFFVVATG